MSELAEKLARALLSWGESRGIIANMDGKRPRLVHAGPFAIDGRVPSQVLLRLGAVARAGEGTRWFLDQPMQSGGFRFYRDPKVVS